MENQGKAQRSRKRMEAVHFLGYCAGFFLLTAWQTAWAKHIRVWGGAPQLPLILLVCMSRNKDAKVALLGGAVCGIFSDLAGGHDVGFDSLLFTCISAGCVGLKSRFFIRSLWQVCFLVFVCVLFYGMAASVIYGVQQGEISFVSVVPNALWSVVATPVFYGLLRRKEV